MNKEYELENDGSAISLSVPEIQNQTNLNYILENGDEWKCYRQAKLETNPDNIKLLQDRVIKSRNAEVCVLFARYIRDVDVGTLQETVLKYGRSHDYYTFARFVNGANISLIQEHILMCGETHDLVNFLKITGVDKTRILDRVLAIGNAWYCLKLSVRSEYESHRERLINRVIKTITTAEINTLAWFGMRTPKEIKHEHILQISRDLNERNHTKLKNFQQTDVVRSLLMSQNYKGTVSINMLLLKILLLIDYTTKVDVSQDTKPSLVDRIQTPAGNVSVKILGYKDYNLEIISPESRVTFIRILDEVRDEYINNLGLVDFVKKLMLTTEITDQNILKIRSEIYNFIADYHRLNPEYNLRDRLTSRIMEPA